MALPDHLPPSFKGTCIKFEFAIHAEARYVLTVRIANAMNDGNSYGISFTWRLCTGCGGSCQHQ